jgi:hypothetical protein
MPLDTTTETPIAPYVTVAKENWQTFFDAFTKVIEGRRVEIEVIGPEVGDQIEAEWLPLNGLTYDRKADTFYVYIEGSDLDHAIPHPREILVSMGAGGVDQVVIADTDGHHHIVRLRQPLMIPQPVG